MISFSSNLSPSPGQHLGEFRSTAGPILDTLEDVFIYGDAQQPEFLTSKPFDFGSIICPTLLTLF